jgi:hypothetical protein
VCQQHKIPSLRLHEREAEPHTSAYDFESAPAYSALAEVFWQSINIVKPHTIATEIAVQSLQRPDHQKACTQATFLGTRDS